jgi:hypothetical protein
LKSYTILVSGPLESRLPKAELISRFVTLKNLIKASNLNVSILISTYPGEAPRELDDLCSEIIYVSDPGPDRFRSAAWPIGSKMRNTTRMLSSTTKGLDQIHSDVTIKTRIELVPNDPQFFVLLDQVSNFVLTPNSVGRGIFIEEHFFGVLHPQKGALYWVPDTFQIMRTKDMRDMWARAHENWKDYSKSWHKNHQKYPLTNEQILGCAYYQEFYELDFTKRIKQFYRYTFNLHSFIHCLESERKNFVLLPFSQLGLTSSRLNKTSKMRGPLNLSPNGQKWKLGVLRPLVRFLLSRTTTKYTLRFWHFLHVMIAKYRVSVKHLQKIILNSKANN